MNYNHHPRNRECNATHYNTLSGNRSDRQRRKVISGFPRLADVDRSLAMNVDQPPSDISQLEDHPVVNEARTTRL